jgi:hypothetical protein
MVPAESTSIRRSRPRSARQVRITPSAAGERQMLPRQTKRIRTAGRWDLDYWQSMTPEERLSALVAIRRDVELVEAGRDEESRER